MLAPQMGLWKFRVGCYQGCYQGRLAAYWGGVVAVVLLSGCSQSAPPQAADWVIYQNPRYGFEFPYPGNWTTAIAAENRDGQAFVDPRQPDVEIRGWASQRSAVAPEEQDPSGLIQPNFETDQGIPGELQVYITPDVSTMELTLVQDDVVFYWRGQSPSAQFSDYYKFFDYVARHYRVPDAAP